MIHGNQANLNTGIQQGNTMHSNNHEEHSSTTVGDITDSTIHHSTFGNQNHQKMNNLFMIGRYLKLILKQ